MTEIAFVGTIKPLHVVEGCLNYRVIMVFISRYFKKLRIAYLKVAFIAIALAALTIPTVSIYESQGFNIYHFRINGKEMGTVDNEEIAEKMLIEARRTIASKSEEIVFIDADVDVEGFEILRGYADDEKDVLANVIKELENSQVSTMKHAYTVKIDDYMVNVASASEAVTLLEASLHKYDEKQQYEVQLLEDTTRELSVLVPEIINTAEIQEENKYSKLSAEDIFENDGMFRALDEVLESIEIDIEPDFDDYSYGITSMEFDNNVEIVEAYLPSEQITDINTAIEDVTKDKEAKTIYEVVSGDTLSGIAGKTGISVDDLIALNENLENANSIIRVGDELTITVPQPELGVIREELKYYEGTYEADVIYIYNDDWYTTKSVTLQDPASGYHKAVEKTTFLNSDAVSTEVIKEEIIAEAIPKIVEKGTKIPPTYIKPISGGRITDGFGSRTSTMKGMSSYHKAVDWGVPSGTSVVASCGGTVTHAGWMSSYGYCVFINHPDGRQTRYAHLSRVLVSKGQTVSQGQKIGLSGNTGVSTGPHLHFEMRINGVAVNPLNYISY